MHTLISGLTVGDYITSSTLRKLGETRYKRFREEVIAQLSSEDCGTGLYNEGFVNKPDLCVMFTDENNFIWNTVNDVFDYYPRATVIPYTAILSIIGDSTENTVANSIKNMTLQQIESHMDSLLAEIKQLRSRADAATAEFNAYKTAVNNLINNGALK